MYTLELIRDFMSDIWPLVGFMAGANVIMKWVYAICFKWADKI